MSSEEYYQERKQHHKDVKRQKHQAILDVIKEMKEDRQKEGDAKKQMVPYESVARGWEETTDKDGKVCWRHTEVEQDTIYTKPIDLEKPLRVYWSKEIKSFYSYNPETRESQYYKQKNE